MGLFSFLKRPRIVLVLLILCMSVLTSKAQLFDMLSNPQITLNLVHPPTMGIKVNKIAFAPPTGRCSDQIINDLISDFVNNNVEVIDRNKVESILSEHNYSNGGYIDQATATAIRKNSGASALVFVRVERCTTQQDKSTGNVNQYDSKTKKNFSVKMFYAKNRAFLKASIQTVDLASGRTFAAQTFDYSPEKVNQSDRGFPEFPSDFDVQDIAYRMLVSDVHNMFISWTEAKTLYFYDDKECGLKAAYQALKSNDLEQAFNLSQQALETSKNTPGTKDKVLGHVNYNMGMCYMLKYDFDKALDYLREAAKLRPGSIVNDAIASCIKQRDLAISWQQIDDAAAKKDARVQARDEKADQKEQAKMFTNADVISLTKQKLSKGIIIQKINASKCNFDTSTKALVALKNAGVSEDVISVMMDRSNQ